MTHYLAPLDAHRLNQQLVRSGLVSRLVRHESATSTNAELVAAAQAPDFAARWPHFAVLTTEEQTGGRGRLGRSWASPKGASLSTSVVLRSTLPRQQWHWLTMLAGQALVRTLRELGLDAELKWPNDVHVQGRKIAGLLAIVPPGDPQALVLGAGINVLLTQEELPTTTATSVLLELQRARKSAPDLGTSQGVAEAATLRTQVLCSWLQHTHDLYSQAHSAGDIAAVREAIVEVISTVGQQVRLELPDGTGVRGTAVGIQQDGALVVEVTSRRRSVLDPEAGGGDEQLWEQVPASVEDFTAGDVVHLRPLQ